MGQIVIPLSLEDIAAVSDGRLVGAEPTTVVEEVATDSRDVPARSLFIALRGETHDGHDYVTDALEAGALAYLAERPIEETTGAVIVDDTWQAIAALGGEVRDRVDPEVVALTGSVGKTTTKDLTAAAIGSQRRTTSAQGSYNNELGVPLTCLATTAETQVLVCEIGARGVGHIASLTPIVRPDIAIVTMVAAAHLEMFGDVDTVARAKGELVEALTADGTAILNDDDERVAAMASRSAGRVVTYGVGARGTTPDVTAENIRLDRFARAWFDVRTPWGSAKVKLPLAGRHHVGNALAALAAAGVLGVEIEAAADGLEDARLSSWRSEVVEAGDVIVLNDAYNANPESTRAALETLVAIECDGRTWAVLGVMAELGAGSAQAHEEIGAACATLGVDRLVVVGEGAEPMLEGARRSGLHSAVHLPDADAALDLLDRDLDAGDVVLVKASRVVGLERVAEGLAARRSSR
jgi:UDP-N-acetylmuramoyl-tripeptide--D-alanyl-D-alanine ligase